MSKPSRARPREQGPVRGSARGKHDRSKDRSQASRTSPYVSLLKLCWPLYGILFLSGTGLYLLSPLLPSMAQDLGLSVPSVASLVTFYSLSYALTAPFLGALSDRIGARPLILWGSALFLVGTALFAGAASLGMLRWTRVAMGIGGAMLGPAIWAFIADNAAQELRGRAIGLGMGAFALGQILGVPGASLVSSVGGWRWAFYGIAAVMVFLVAAATRWSRPSLAPRSRKLDRRTNSRWLPARPSRGVLAALVVTFLFHAANLGAYAYLGARFSAAFGISAGKLGMIGVLVGAGSLAGSLLGGYSIDALRRWKIPGRFLAALWGVVLCGALWMTVSGVSLPVSLMGLVMWFTASGAFTTTQLATLTQASRQGKAGAVSWNQAVMYLGAGTGVWIIGTGLSQGLALGAMSAALAASSAFAALLLSQTDRIPVAGLPPRPRPRARSSDSARHLL